MSGLLPTSDKLTEAEQAQALKKIRELEKQQGAVEKKAVDQYVNSVKQSMLFRPGYNWSEMLSAAPTSVYLLGSLFIASTNPDAQNIKIIAPAGGFRTLLDFESPSLSTCLIQCSDKGSKSFMIAATSMDAIALKSTTIKATVSDIIKILGNPAEAQVSLGPTIKQLAKLAESCETEAHRVATTFEEWLDMVCEIHACVAQTSSDTSEKRTANANHLAAAQTRLVGQENIHDAAQKDLNTMRDCLETAKESYKKAADEFPSGWELIAQEFVSTLGDTVTTAVNQVIPTLIEHYSTTAQIKGGAQIFSGGVGTVRGGSAGEEKRDHSDAPHVNAAPNPTPPAVLPYSSDPAYASIGPILTLITAAQSFLTGGEDRGIDWKTLESKDPNKGANGLGVLVIMIEKAKETFKPSSDPPSTTLTAILNDTLKVTAELEKALKYGKTLGGKYPAPDSPEVAQWQKSIIAANAQAVQLNTEAKNVTNAYSAPMITKPDAGVNPQDKKGALRKQIIDAATTKLTSTAQVLNTASTNFQKSSEQVIEIQQSIVAIQAELTQLKATNMSLDKIREILTKCIEILVELKSQINRLVGFFSAVVSLVDHAVEIVVDPFIENLRATTGFEDKKILNLSFTQFQQQIVFTLTLGIRAYFELFIEISTMYRDIHDQHIRSGLELVNNLSAEYSLAPQDKAEQILADRTKKLVDYNLEATKGVCEIVNNSQAEIANSLQSNATAAANAMAFVPVAQPEIIQKAIEKPNEQSKEIAAKAISQTGSYIRRKLGSTAELV